MNRIIRKFSSVSNTMMNMKVKNKFAIVEFNNPNSSVNVINKQFSQELAEILDKYDKENLNAIIFKSSNSLLSRLAILGRSFLPRRRPLKMIGYFTKDNLSNRPLFNQLIFVSEIL